MRQKINIITLGVKDYKKSLAFFEKGLGWEKSSASQDDIAFFPLGGMAMALYPRDLLEKDATVKFDKGYAGITLAYNAKNEKEVDEVLDTVKKLGAKIIKPAAKVFWGGYSGYFEDIDGHLWEVAHNPFLEFDEKDNLVLP